ncbi:MAG TPA: metallophosphoesterase [Gemmatimonadaceae bacterium]
MPDVVRILFLADTHLGFDLPVRPRIERRRRGHDFLANYASALQPALAGEVDLVVHGGDVFNRSRPVPSLAYQAFEPLSRVADRGIPVFIVPGNHERGRLPHIRFAQHPGIHVFDAPRTFVVEVRGVSVALAGFPSERDAIRARFTQLLEATRWRDIAADVRLLCLHQCIEGSSVGPGNYTFTTAPDVIRCTDIPSGFDAVLSGHIHRHQVLTRDLSGHPLRAPVLYPGSIERTSIAEADEDKGFLLVEIVLANDLTRVSWRFQSLPARPLVRCALDLDACNDSELDRRLRALLTDAPSDAVLTIRIEGTMTQHAARLLSAANLRSLAPPTMNVELRLSNRAEAMPRATS